MEAPYQFWVSNSNLCQKKRTVDCRTWKVKRNRFGFSEGWRVLMNEYWDWDLHWRESCQKKVETYSVILCQRTWLTAAWSNTRMGLGQGQQLFLRCETGDEARGKEMLVYPFSILHLDADNLQWNNYAKWKAWDATKK